MYWTAEQIFKSIAVHFFVLGLASSLILTQMCELFLLEWQSRVESAQVFQTVLASQVERCMTEHSNELHGAPLRSQRPSLIFQHLYVLLDKEMSYLYHLLSLQMTTALWETEKSVCWWIQGHVNEPLSSQHLLLWVQLIPVASDLYWAFI